MQKEICSIKLAISYTLKKFIEKLVKDIRLWQNDILPEERVIIGQLEELITNEDKSICDDRCLGCLEYEIMYEIWTNFYNNVSKINKSYEEVNKYIQEKLDLKKHNDPIELATNLISNPSYVEKSLEENQINKHRQYVEKINNSIKNLRLDFYNHKILELHDEILKYLELPQKQKILQKSTTINKNYKTFYLDQNFIGKYIKDDSFKRQINNIKEKAKYQFTFSPYLIEDGIKMDEVFLKEYFEHISSLTDGLLISRYDNKLTYVYEELNCLVERIRLWLKPTRAAESLKLYKHLYNNEAYPDFKNRKNPIYNKINDDIVSFLKTLEGFDKNSSHNQSIEKLIYGYFIRNSFSFRLEDLQEGHIEVKDDSDCMDKIDKLCSFLDFINYQTDQEEQKIKSSYQDTEHLKHAWKCHYFISDDEKLRKRGKYIYSLLGIDTEFITIEEFKNMIISYYKK